MTTLMTTVGSNLLYYFLSGTNPLFSSDNTIFGVVNQAVSNSLIFSICILPWVAYFESFFYSDYKDCKNTEKGINSELEYLKNQITIEKQKLEELQKDKKKNGKDKKFEVVTVDDKAKLAELKSDSDFYYNLGYNENKYFKYYQQGKLDYKLKKDYTDAGIEAAKKYLEEKRPTLIKNHNKKIK